MTATVRGGAAPARRPAPRTRQAPAPRRPDLRVVEPRRNLRALGVIGTVAVFGLLFGLVLFHTVLVQNQQRLDRLQGAIREAQAQYQAQRLQVAQLEAPARVVVEATTRLGMVPPPGTTYLTPSAGAAAAVGATSAAAGTPADPAGATDWRAVKPYLSEQG